MHNPLAHFYRLAVPAARIAAGLAFGASGARADADGKPRGIGVEVHTLDDSGLAPDTLGLSFTQ